VCRAELTAASDDAALASSVLASSVLASSAVGSGAADVDVDLAWSRLSHSVAADAAPQVADVAPLRRRRRRLRSPAVAAVGVAALLSGAGVAAAADWLQVFRTERFAPVEISQADLVALPDLSSYGSLDVVSEPELREVADAEAAERATGLDVPEVDELPRGVLADQEVRVSGEVSAVFTYDAATAAQTAAAAGEALPPAPAGMDGSRFRLEAGPGVATLWSEARGLPAMVVARAVAPTGFSSRVPFETARDHLLSLPGLPDDVAQQLRGFSGDGTTLPLPLPAHLVETSTAQVDGVEATVLTARDGFLSGVVWVEDGIVTAVAGSLTTDEVLSVARGLR
jgi:hypothetical protein